MKSERQSVSSPIAFDGGPRGSVCGWDAPDGAHRVTLDSALIRELRQAAIQAFLAIPRRGVEIGGLLFGQVRQEPPGPGTSETAVFEIAAFEDVPCEHRFGPSYILDELDRKHLVELLARQQGNGYPPVVGFYRSYTGREARMDEADRELIQAFFPHRHFSCLLLQPLSMERCAAAFRFWNDGEILPEPADDPFPFEAAQMRQEAAHLPAAAAGPDGPRTDVVDNTEGEPPEIQPEIAPETLPEIPPEIQSEARQPAPTPSLAFYSGVNRHRRYEDEDEEAAPEAGRPSRILLPLLFCILVAIASAASYKLWQVSREPRWVQVHLDARASSPRELVLSWDAAAPAVAQATRGVLAVTGGRKPVEIQLSPEQVRRGSFSYSPFSDSPSQVDVLFQIRFYDEENQVAADSLRVIGLPSPAPVVAAISAEPGPVAAPAPANPPAAGLATGPAVSPPTARHEVQPVIPPGIQRRIRARTVVPVVVQVDESGHVTRAASKVNGHGLVRYLAGEAVKAARLWSFSPARSKEGSPVASTQTISFEFAPAGR